MQEKYQANFATLTAEEADYFADAICGSLEMNLFDSNVDVTGESLFAALADVDHKTACMSLANDPSPMAVVILEKIVGQPVHKQTNQTEVAGSTKTSSPRAPAGPRPKVAKNDPRTIHDIKEGAKRPGSKSYDRYMLYKEGMTVTEFIAAGGTSGDVAHDVSKGFITLKDPA